MADRIDDLLTRLRNTHTSCESGTPCTWCANNLEAAAEITQLRKALRNVAQACNQLEGYPDLSRERQVELVQAIRRFTGVNPTILRGDTTMSTDDKQQGESAQAEFEDRIEHNIGEYKTIMGRLADNDDLTVRLWDAAALGDTP